jgi:hypothetical protein
LTSRAWTSSRGCKRFSALTLAYSD